MRRVTMSFSNAKHNIWRFPIGVYQHPLAIAVPYFQPLAKTMCLCGRNILFFWIKFELCVSQAEHWRTACLCVWFIFPNKATEPVFSISFFSVISISLDQYRPNQQLFTLQIMKSTSSTLTCKDSYFLRDSVDNMYNSHHYVAFILLPIWRLT